MTQAILILAGLALPWFLMRIKERHVPEEDRIDYTPGLLATLIPAAIILSLLVAATEAQPW